MYNPTSIRNPALPSLGICPALKATGAGTENI